MSVRTMGRAWAMLASLAFVAPVALLSVSSASALDQPKTPDAVADYFANELIPRLIDLYGSGNGVTEGIDFDATTQVGTITRVREFTPDFLAGRVTADPTRLTNDWVATVRVHGAVLGLATVWINPASSKPELATFDSSDVAHQIARAPEGSWLVHDPQREAWFALTEAGLIPLVAGSSGVTAMITPTAYQRLIEKKVPDEMQAPSDVPVAALVLGVVIVGVAIFVLLPVGRKKRVASADEEVADELEDSH